MNVIVIMLQLLFACSLFGQNDLPLIDVNAEIFKQQIQKSGFIYHRSGDHVMVLGVPEILKELKAKKIPFKTVFKTERAYQKQQKAVISNAGFVQYDDVIARIEEMVQDYPDLFAIEILGYSVNGRAIIALKTLGEEFRPKYRVAGGIHGNEAMAYQFVYDLVGYFKDSLDGTLSQDDQLLVQELLENTEIWFIPMINPDGAVAVSRRNSNNIDLNRNFGFFWKAQTASGSSALSEPEVKAMKWNTLNELFTLSFSFHTYGDYINYVWNFAPDDATDHSEVVNLSELYHQYTPDYTVIEGYDWYQTFGDLNDYCYGTSGDIDWTLEVEDSDPDNSLYEQNRDAVLACLNTYKQGVIGQVLNSDGVGVRAAFKRSTGDTLFYTNTEGEFYRYLESGTHHYQVYAPGYGIFDHTITIEGTERITSNPVAMIPKYTLYPFQVIEVYQEVSISEGTETELPQRLLLPPDQRYFKLNRSARVVVSLPDRTGTYFLEPDLKDQTQLSKLEFYRHDGDDRGTQIIATDGAFLVEDSVHYLEIVGVTSTATTDIPELDTIALIPQDLCDAGYHLFDNNCEPDEITVNCDNILPEFAQWGDQNPNGVLEQEWDDEQLKYLPDSCAWDCSGDYARVGDLCVIDQCSDENEHLEGDECVSNQRTVACGNELPQFGKWSLENNDGFLSQIWSDSAQKYLPEIDSCKWGCLTGYENQNGLCVKLYYNPCYPTNPCTQENKTICQDQDKDEIAECSCLPEYHLEESACLGNYRLANCTNELPENSSWNGDATFIQEWDATQEQYLPKSDHCSWSCISGYHQVDNLCVSTSSSSSGDGCGYGGHGTPLAFLFLFLILLGFRRER